MMQTVVYLLHLPKSRVSDPLRYYVWIRSATTCGATSRADQKLLTYEYDFLKRIICFLASFLFLHT